MIGALYGIFSNGQVMEVLAGSAFAPAGDSDLSRRILGTAHHQSLMIRHEFDPSSTVVAINKAIIKKEKKNS